MTKEETDNKIKQLILGIEQKYSQGEKKLIPCSIKKTIPKGPLQAGNDNAKLLDSVLRNLANNYITDMNILSSVINDLNKGMEEIIGRKIEISI
jgi:hypothetical protein